MAGTHIRIDLNTRPVLDALQSLRGAAGDLQPAFRDIGEYWLISTRARFDAEQAPDGTPWQPLNAGYQARKKKNADKILVLEGYLRDTLRYHVSPDELALGSDRVYAATQHFGAPERGILARPWLGLSAADEREVLTIIQDHLARAFD